MSKIDEFERLLNTLRAQGYKVVSTGCGTKVGRPNRSGYVLLLQIGSFVEVLTPSPGPAELVPLAEAQRVIQQRLGELAPKPIAA